MRFFGPNSLSAKGLQLFSEIRENSGSRLLPLSRQSIIIGAEEQKSDESVKGEVMKASTKIVMGALKAMGKEVISGKGGFWIRGEGFVTLAQARRLVGIPAPKRVKKAPAKPWGDYATIAALNGIRLD
jgi:hypothetical protein